MSKIKTVTIRCNCGCKEKVVNAKKAGWLKLSQFRYSRPNDNLKIMGKLHFVDIDHLQTWLNKASAAVDEMQDSVRGMEVRGVMTNDRVEGLQI